MKKLSFNFPWEKTRELINDVNLSKDLLYKLIHSASWKYEKQMTEYLGIKLNTLILESLKYNYKLFDVQNKIIGEILPGTQYILEIETKEGTMMFLFEEGNDACVDAYFSNNKLPK